MNLVQLSSTQPENNKMYVSISQFRWGKMLFCYLKIFSFIIKSSSTETQTNANSPVTSKWKQQCTILKKSMQLLFESCSRSYKHTYIFITIGHIYWQQNNSQYICFCHGLIRTARAMAMMDSVSRSCGHLFFLVSSYLMGILFIKLVIMNNIPFLGTCKTFWCNAFVDLNPFGYI